MIRTLLVFTVAIGLALIGHPAAAQLSGAAAPEVEAVELPDPLTEETARELVSRLSDAEVRALLLERLDAVAAEREKATEDEMAIRAFLVRNAEGIGRHISKAITGLPDALVSFGKAFQRFAEPRGATGLVTWAAFLALALLAGFAAEFVLMRVVRVLGIGIPDAAPRPLGATLRVLVHRVFLDFGGLAIFIAAAALVIWKVMPDTARFNREAAWALITVPLLYARLAAAGGRFLLAPVRTDLRLVNTDDWTARFIYRHQIRLAFLIGVLHFLVPFLLSHGARGDSLIIAFWIGLGFYSYLIWVTWTARRGLTAMLRGTPGEVTRGEDMVARAFPWIAIVLIVMNWLLVAALIGAEEWDLLDGRSVRTLIILLFAPAMDTMIRGLVRHLAPPMSGEGALAEAAHLATKRSYIRIGRLIVMAVVIYAIARLWQIDFQNVAAAGIGLRFAAQAIETVLILASGYLFWELCSLWINRRLAAEQTAAGGEATEEEVGGEGGGTGGSRLSTVLPLLLGVLKVTIATIFLLIALGNIGIDTTPLLAGAGIVGLAIGFGAQKLVTDVVSGVFFLIDDAFRTGEYIEVDGTFGTVEKISIRSVQLRHHKGPVHTIPYGEIPKLTNYSRDWVIMKLRFTVPFDTDPNKVKKIFKKIGAEMMEVPEYAADLLQPFKSQGVFDFDDVGMIIRGKFMAKPGRQFVLRKEIFNRVKAAFEANGIAFARREVRVAIPGLEHAGELSDEDKAKIAAAATEAAQQAVDGQTGGDQEPKK